MATAISRISLIILAATPFGAAAHVMVSELMYDLPGADTGREWIEIYNAGSAAVDLTGWKLFEGDTNHTLVISRGNGMLPSGGYAIIADKPEKFLAENLRFSGTLFDSAFSLNNSAGEMISLKDAKGVLFGEISYTPVWGAEGDGYSLQYFSDGWHASNPTPGAVNIKSSPQSAPAQMVKEEQKPSSVSGDEIKIVQERGPLDRNEEGVAKTISESSIRGVSDRESGFPWSWLSLAAGVVVVSGAAYWIAGREKPDEFTIVDVSEKDPV